MFSYRSGYSVSPGRTTVSLNRLERFDGRGEAALQAFDSRLAQAAGLLQRAGFWEETLARGGSRPALLQLARTQSNTPPEVHAPTLLPSH